MTVDQTIARSLLKQNEIEQIESFGDEPRSSVEADGYHVLLLRYAERIMFSPLMNGAASDTENRHVDFSDRATEELSRIRQEIERISKPVH